MSTVAVRHDTVVPLRRGVHVLATDLVVSKVFHGLVVYYWVMLALVPADSAFGASDWRLAALLVPIAAFIVFSFTPALEWANVKRVWPLWCFAVPALLMSAARLDARSVATLILIAAPFMIVVARNIEVDQSLLMKLFVASIVTSVAAYHLGVHRFGYLPGQDADGLLALRWRVTLFPFVTPPASGAFALMIGVLSWFGKRRPLVLLASAYFVVLSASRSVLLATVGVVLLLALDRIRGRARRPVLLAAPALIIGIALFFTFNPALVVDLATVDSPVVNNVLFRTIDVPENVAEVVEDAKRADIWRNHLVLFRDNPVAGLGTFSIYDRFPGSPGLAEVGIAVLMVRYGIWALFLMGFLYLWYARRSEPLQVGAVVAFIMMTLLVFYGSFARPSNFVFLALIGLLCSNAVLRRRPRLVQPPAPAAVARL